MIAKDENLLVKVVKKAVGLPTGKSSCCGAVVPAAQECSDGEAAPSTSTGCGCASAPDQEEEHPAQA